MQILKLAAFSAEFFEISWCHKETVEVLFRMELKALRLILREMTIFRS